MTIDSLGTLGDGTFDLMEAMKTIVNSSSFQSMDSTALKQQLLMMAGHSAAASSMSQMTSTPDSGTLSVPTSMNSSPKMPTEDAVPTAVEPSECKDLLKQVCADAVLASESVEEKADAFLGSLSLPMPLEEEREELDDAETEPPSVEKAALDLKRLLSSTMDHPTPVQEPCIEDEKEKKVVALQEELSEMERKLDDTETQFMQDTKLMCDKQNEARRFIQECSDVKARIDALLRSIEPLQKQLADAEIKKKEADGLVSTLCSRIGNHNVVIQQLKQEIDAKREEIIKNGGNITKPSESRVSSSSSSSTYDPFSPGLYTSNRLDKPANSTYCFARGQDPSDSGRRTTEDPYKRTHSEKSEKSGDQKVPCLAYNRGECNNPKCSSPHACAFCFDPKHPFYKCNTKPYICLPFNRNACRSKACSKMHVCLMCHGNHPLSDETCSFFRNLKFNAPQKDYTKFCLNWNAAGVCKIEHCIRFHRCIFCNHEHTSMDCPNFLDRLIKGEMRDIIPTHLRHLKSVDYPLNDTRKRTLSVSDEYNDNKRYRGEKVHGSNNNSNNNKTKDSEGKPIYCHHFENSGKCKYTAGQCWYLHECRVCGSPAHSVTKCPLR